MVRFDVCSIEVFKGWLLELSRKHAGHVGIGAVFNVGIDVGCEVGDEVGSEVGDDVG